MRSVESCGAQNSSCLRALSRACQPLEQLLIRLALFFKGELLAHSLPATCSHEPASIGVREQVADTCGEGGWIAGRDKEAADTVLNNFRSAAHRGCHHRDGRGECLQHDYGKPF